MSGTLKGWTVVVTRAEGDKGPLGAAFETEGAHVLRIPTVEVGPPGDADGLTDALERIDGYDWIVFTSPRAVEAVAGRGVRGRERLRVAVVGPSTAESAAAAGFVPTVVGDGQGAEALAERLVHRRDRGLGPGRRASGRSAHGDSGRSAYGDSGRSAHGRRRVDEHRLDSRGVGRGDRVLFPASSRAGSTLERVLTRAGASVDRVTAYETRSISFDPARLPELSEVDLVTFTSPSALEGWVSAMSDDPARFLPETVRYVVIGDTTGAAAEAAGLDPIRAPESSFEGMVWAARALAEVDDSARAARANSDEQAP